MKIIMSQCHHEILPNTGKKKLLNVTVALYLKLDENGSLR